MDDLTIEQAKDIMHNPQNPDHQAYGRKTNPDVVRAVNAAFERAYPGNVTITENGTAPEDMTFAAVAEAEQPKAEQPKAEQPKVEILPEVKQTIDAVDYQLRSEWGPAFDQNLRSAAEVAQELFGSADAIDEFSQRTGLDRDPQLQVRAVKLLADLAKKRRR